VRKVLKVKNILMTFIVMAAVILWMAGCGAGASVKDGVTSSDSHSGGSSRLEGMQLNILGSYHEDMVKRMAEMFENETGCSVSYLRMPTGEAVARLIAEKEDPVVSVYIGGTIDAHENLKHQGVLVPYESPVEREISGEYVDPDGVWKAQYIETLSIGVNTERWKAEFPGRVMPSTLEELLDPAFRGDIVTSDPYTSGTGYTFVSSVLQFMGEEEGWAYIEKFNEQVGQYTTSGYTPAEKAGFGEYLICVNFLSDQLIVSTSGYPLASTVYEGAGWSMCPVSIVTGSEDNAAARKFVDFCIGKKALDALVELGNCVAVRDDCIAPVGGSKLSDLRFNRDYSPVEAAAFKTEILERFREVVLDYH